MTQSSLEEQMHSPDLLRVTTEELEHARVIRPAGEVELNTARVLRHELDTARNEAATTLLDLSDVTFMDSTGLQLLLEASRRSAESEWIFLMVRPSEPVRRLIELSRTEDLLTLVDAPPAPILG